MKSLQELTGLIQKRIDPKLSATPKGEYLSTPKYPEQEKARAAVSLMYRERGEQVPLGTKVQWGVESPLVEKAIWTTVFPGWETLQSIKNILVAHNKGEKITPQTLATPRSLREIPQYTQLTESPTYTQAFKNTIKTSLPLYLRAPLSSAIDNMTPQTISSLTEGIMETAGFFGGQKVTSLVKQRLKESVADRLMTFASGFEPIKPLVGQVGINKIKQDLYNSINNTSWWKLLYAKYGKIKPLFQPTYKQLALTGQVINKEAGFAQLPGITKIGDIKVSNQALENFRVLTQENKIDPVVALKTVLIGTKIASDIFKQAYEKKIQQPFPISVEKPSVLERSTDVKGIWNQIRKGALSKATPEQAKFSYDYLEKVWNDFSDIHIPEEQLIKIKDKLVAKMGVQLPEAPKPPIVAGEGKVEQSLWHETSSQGLDYLMSHSDASGLNVSTDKSLALGQGGKGILVELNKDILLGKEGKLWAIKKPGTAMVGQKEFQVGRASNKPGTIKSITIQEGIPVSKVQKIILNRDYDKIVNEDKSITFTPKLSTPAGEAELPLSITMQDLLSEEINEQPLSINLKSIDKNWYQAMLDEFENAKPPSRVRIKSEGAEEDVWKTIDGYPQWARKQLSNGKWELIVPKTAIISTLKKVIQGGNLTNKQQWVLGQLVENWHKEQSGSRIPDIPIVGPPKLPPVPPDQPIPPESFFPKPDDPEVVKIKQELIGSVYNLDGELKLLVHPELGGKLTMSQNLKNALTNARARLRDIDLALLPIDVIFDILDGGSGLYNGAHYKYIKKKMDKNWNNYYVEKEVWQKPLRGLANELKLTEHNFLRIAVHAIRTQKGGINKLLNTGLSTRTIKEVVLNSQEIQWYKAWLEMADLLYPELRKVIEEVFDAPLGKVKDYFTFATDWEVMDDQHIKQLFIAPIQIGEIVAKPGIAEQRKLGEQILQLNAFEIAMRYIDNVAYIKNMAADLKMLEGIITSDEYKSKAGESSQQLVMEWLDLLARKGGVGGQKAITSIDWIRKHTGLGVLGFKLSSIIIQPTSLIDAIGYIGHDAVSGFIEILTNKEAFNFCNQFPEIRSRVGDDPAFLDYTNWNKFLRMGMMPLEKLDKLTAMGVGLGSYNKKMRELGLKIDYRIINIDAMEYAQAMVRTTQSTGQYKDVPLALSKGKFTGNRSIDRAIFQFQNFILRRWARVRYDAPKAITKQKDYKKAVSIYFWTIMALLAESGIRTGMQSVKQEIMGKKKGKKGKTFTTRLALDALQTIPFVSQGMSFMIYGSNPIPALETISSFPKAISTIIRSKRIRTKLKGGVMLGTSVGRTIGVPGTAEIGSWLSESLKEPLPIKKGFERIKELLEERSGTKEQYNRIEEILKQRSR